MKKNLTAFLFLTAALVSATSCLDDKGGIVYTSYMTAVVPGNGQPLYFVADDSTRINILNYKNFHFQKELKTNDRIKGGFTVPSGVITNPTEAELVMAENVLTKDILVTDRPDTVGNSGIEAFYTWHCGGVEGISRFVNITFEFLASNSGIQHVINLTLDPASVPDENGLLPLTLTHDNQKDPEQFKVSGVVSFPLTEKLTAPEIKGLKIKYKILPEKEGYITVRY